MIRPRQNSSPQSNSTQARKRLSRGRRIGTVLVLLVALLVFADWWTVIPASQHATYVGRQSCILCHKQQALLYQDSDHDRAMDFATEATVLGDFQDASITHDGQTSRMFRRNEKFMINTEGPDGQFQDFEIKYVLGVRPLQQYMVEMNRPTQMPANEHSRVQVLRISWDTERQQWFYLRPPDVSERLEPADELHWTGITQCWNTSCADCHSTNLQRMFDMQTGIYHTTFSEIDVSCEACHGPGSVHVQLAESFSLFWDRIRGYGLPQLRNVSAEKQIQVCAPCHSQRLQFRPGFQPGDDFLEHYQPQWLFDIQGVSHYHADGQIREEVYEYGSYLQSKMYHKNIRCTDCHDPHSSRVRHRGNALCTSCHAHPAGKYDGVSHHHHQPDSPGASCVECHMPVTHYMDIDPRRDHSLRVRRPALSVTHSTPNACTGCHLKPESVPAEKRNRLKHYADWIRLASEGDADVRDAVRATDQAMHKAVLDWYGSGSEMAASLHYGSRVAQASHDSERREELLTTVFMDQKLPAIVRASALHNLRDSRSDQSLDQSLEYVLSDATDRLLRVAAMFRLDAEVERLSMRLMSESMSVAESKRLGRVMDALSIALEDPAAIIRVASARTMLRLSLDQRNQQLSGSTRRKLWQAQTELQAGHLAEPDRAASHMALALIADSQQDFQQAESEYRAAMQVEPRIVGPRSNLASLLESRGEAFEQRAVEAAQGGQRAQAEALAETWAQVNREVRELREQELKLLKRDAELFPKQVSIQYRYGLLLYLNGQEQAAEAVLARTIELNPHLPDARMALALLYQKQKRIADARVHAEELVREFPQEAVYRRLLDELRP